VELTLKEHLLNNYCRTEDYKDIVIKDLEPNEILEAVMEFYHRTTVKWTEKEEDIIKQNIFWEIIRNGKDFNKMHGWIHPEARIGTSWLNDRDINFLQ